MVVLLKTVANTFTRLLYSEITTVGSPAAASKL